MAQKTRMINTKFWSDDFVVDKLNPLDRYLFLYFLTNERTNISGIYELSKTVICRETGIDKETLPVMLRTLEPKVHYFEGWVILPNFVKNQNQKSPTVKIGISNELCDIPEKVLEYAISIGYTYGIDTLSHLNLNLNLNLKKENKNFLHPKTHKEFLNQYRERAGNPPMEKMVLSEKQQISVRSMKLLSRIHDAGIKYGYDYLNEEDEQANKKYQGQVKPFEKRYQTIQQQDEYIEWFFTAPEIAYANGHPSNFFSVSTWLVFDNRKNTKSNKSKGMAL